MSLMETFHGHSCVCSRGWVSRAEFARGCRFYGSIPQMAGLKKHGFLWLRAIVEPQSHLVWYILVPKTTLLAFHKARSSLEKHTRSKNLRSKFVSLPSRQCQGAQQMRFGPAATTVEALGRDGPGAFWAWVLGG